MRRRASHSGLWQDHRLLPLSRQHPRSQSHHGVRAQSADAVAIGSEAPRRRPRPRNSHAPRIVARAWIRVIWACWHSGVPYDPAAHDAGGRATPGRPTQAHATWCCSALTLRRTALTISIASGEASYLPSTWSRHKRHTRCLAGNDCEPCGHVRTYTASSLLRPGYLFAHRFPTASPPLSRGVSLHRA